ncbi:MAG: YgjV family protein [Clostridia bacterium]|nr:YgjV family protein [Clostridia bacterium]
MKLFAQMVGLFAVMSFLLSYQQKTRKNIIVWNVTSRCLYIAQYIMLGAFEGAVLDVLGTISSVVAQNKDKKLIRKYLKLFVIVINLIILVAGLFLYENIFSLFPIIGVILHTSAFWISEEKTIRRMSFGGSPFWLVYNLTSCAYGSAIGDVLTMISIGIAIYRYDIKKQK